MLQEWGPRAAAVPLVGHTTPAASPLSPPSFVMGDAQQNLLGVWRNRVVDDAACLLICDIYSVEELYSWAHIDI